MVHRSGSFEGMALSVARQLDAGDNRAALAVIAAHWPQVSSSDGKQLRDLIESLPFDDWNSDPWILAALGASYRSLGSLSRSAALPYFGTAEALLDAAESPSIHTIAGVRTQFAAALRSLGQFTAAQQRAKSAWELLESDVGLTPSLRIAAQARAALQLGMIAIHSGDYDAANTHLRLALGLSDQHLSQPELVECLSGLGFLEYTAGDFDAANRFVARVRAAGTPELLDSQFAALAAITELLIAVERNRLAETLSLATRVAGVTERTDWQALGLYATAAISIISGRHIEGLDDIHRALKLTQSWDGPMIIRVLCEGMRGTLLMHLDDLDAAIEIIESLAPTQNHANCPARFIAGIRFKAGDSAGCLEALRDCEKLGENHSSRTMIDVLLLKAAAHYELDNPVVADVAFDRALLFVGKTQIRTPFTLVPNVTMQRMLNRASDRKQPEAVHTLLKDLLGGHGNPQYGAIEPLSEREKDVAQQLYLDKTMSQIAAELFISTNTVKTHMRSIYRKLDASNRKEAIRRVEELGLYLEITPI